MIQPDKSSYYKKGANSRTELLWLLYLLEQLWGGVCCQDGWGHVWTDSVQLLDLSLPHLQQPLPSFIHPLPTRPLTLQVEREACLLPLSPEITQRSTGNWPLDRTQNEPDGAAKGFAYLKGASATALVVMAMWSEKSFQVDKKRTETPVWSWRCTTAWWDNGILNDVNHY